MSTKQLGFVNSKAFLPDLPESGDAEETEPDLWSAVLHTGLGFGGLHHGHGPLDEEVLLFTSVSCRTVNVVPLNVG